MSNNIYLSKSDGSVDYLLLQRESNEENKMSSDDECSDTKDSIE